MSSRRSYKITIDTWYFPLVPVVIGVCGGYFMLFILDGQAAATLYSNGIQFAAVVWFFAEWLRRVLNSLGERADRANDQKDAV